MSYRQKQDSYAMAGLCVVALIAMGFIAALMCLLTLCDVKF